MVFLLYAVCFSASSVYAETTDETPKTNGEDNKKKDPVWENLEKELKSLDLLPNTNPQNDESSASSDDANEETNAKKEDDSQSEPKKFAEQTNQVQPNSTEKKKELVDTPATNKPVPRSTVNKKGLHANIGPSSIVISKGQSVSFKNTGTNKQVRYYWQMQKQTSHTSAFTPDTTALKPGTYKVRLTLTDKNRKQVHAIANLTVKSGTGAAQNTTNPVDNTTAEVGESSNVATAGNGVLAIIPKQLNIMQGLEAVFKNKHETRFNELRYFWQVGSQNSTAKQFKVDTLKLKPGKHTITLSLTHKGKVLKDTAVVTITPRANRRVPNLVGLTVSNAMTVLLEDGLKVGSIQQRKAKVDKASVVQQSLKPGTMVKTGQIINLVEGLPDTPETNKVRISASLSSIQTGGVVKFVASVNPKPKNNKGMTYLFTINGKQHKSLQPNFSWRFDKLGTYPAFVIARNAQGALGKSNTIRINVSKVWQKPEAKILPEMLVIQQGDRAEFTSTSTYDLQSSLVYAWKSKTGNKGDKKRFIFETKDIDPGRYEIELQVVDNKKLTSKAVGMLVLQPASAEGVTQNSVKHQPVGDHTGITDSKKKEIEPSLRLDISDHYARVGDHVRLTLSTDMSSDKAEYQFFTGHQADSDWLSDNQFQHQYTSFGSYSVKAAMKLGDKVYYSKPKTVWVWSPALFFSIGGIGTILLILMWWWTGRGVTSRKSSLYHSEVVNDNSVVTFRQMFFYLIQFLLALAIAGLALYMVF